MDETNIAPSRAPTKMVFSVGELLAGSKVKKEKLTEEVTAEHRNEIALKLGGDWETLAPFIGIPVEDIHDIIESVTNSRDRRLAMLRKWGQLYGRSATYSKLVEGLEKIGRRDLSEAVVCLLGKAKCEPPPSSYVHQKPISRGK